ncbi:MAG: c-type cytochrome [Sulfurospirillum sp.]
MYTSMRNLTLLIGSVAFVTNLGAAKLDYTPAGPNHYPYPSVEKNKQGLETNVDGAIIRKKVIKVKEVYKSQISGKNHNFGKKASREIIKAWNTDVRPDGKGLPDGKMSVEEGAQVFAAKCAVCHGDFGEGVDRFPVLAGGIGTLKLHPKSGGDPGPLKTIGSYAPYIAPFFWYIQTAMPLSAPKSLSNSQVYGILGYLLQLNEIKVNGVDIEDNTIIDRKFIKSVHLPNEKGFEYNNLRKPDTHNTRCMKDCTEKSKMIVMHIKTDATVVDPPFGKGRYYFGTNYSRTVEAKYPNHTKKISKDDGIGKSVYENTCAGCHNSGVAGAPKFGNKADWAHVGKENLKTVFDHAINGFNSMPPKGGDTTLKDADVKDAVKYMLKNSK